VKYQCCPSVNTSCIRDQSRWRSYRLLVSAAKSRQGKPLLEGQIVRRAVVQDLDLRLSSTSIDLHSRRRTGSEHVTPSSRPPARLFSRPRTFCTTVLAILFLGSAEMSYLPCRICTKDVVRRSPRITTRITPPPHARSARLEPSSCDAGTAP
jgi:hypothetical protein